jgi:hypothetical protein
MVTREQVLDEVRRTAADNGGKQLGSKRFATETGIRPHEWQRFWPRWGDVLKEAGYDPNPFGVARDPDEALALLVQEVRRMGRLPTGREREIKHREDPEFPSEGVFRRLGRQQQIARKLIDFCRAHPGNDDVPPMLAPLLGDGATRVEDDSSPPTPESEVGFVYMLRSGRNYKIGRTNSAGRRARELAIQLPERVTQVHVIKTDDPVGIEAYWHRRFADARKNGEWFELTPADVQAFRRRKFM